MITPIFFLVLFLIAATFSFYTSDSDRLIAKSVAKEGEIKKLITDVEKNLTSMCSLAYETIYQNNEINEKSEMEEKIEDELQSGFGVSTEVDLEDAAKNNTKIKINFKNYVIKKGDIKLNMSDSTYETILGYPYYRFYDFYRTYDRKELCSYVDWGKCEVNEKRYEDDKLEETGFYWDLNMSSESNCPSRKLVFYIDILDPNHVVTFSYNFKLKDRTTGNKKFVVNC